MSGSCHGNKINNFIDNVHEGKITPLVIDVDLSNPSIFPQVQWNFVVKTYMCKEKILYCIKKGILPIDLEIDSQNITDDMRIKRIEHHLGLRIFNKSESKLILPSYPKEFLTVDYNKLFIPGGSIYLCDVLGLDVGEVYHDYWDKMLKFSNAPDTITAYGKTWNKNDYFK
jgi:hypothetical protein